MTNTLRDSRLKPPTLDYRKGRARICGNCHHAASHHMAGHGVGTFGRYEARTSCQVPLFGGLCSCTRSQGDIWLGIETTQKDS
jgi:hypothetical protein